MTKAQVKLSALDKLKSLSAEEVNAFTEENANIDNICKMVNDINKEFMVRYASVPKVEGNLDWSDVIHHEKLGYQRLDILSIKDEYKETVEKHQLLERLEKTGGMMVAMIGRKDAYNARELKRMKDDAMLLGNEVKSVKNAVQSSDNEHGLHFT